MEWRKGCCTNPYSCRQNYILCIYAHILYVFPGIGFLDFSRGFRRVAWSHIYHFSKYSRYVATLYNFLFGQRKARMQRRKTSLTTGGGAIHSCIVSSIKYVETVVWGLVCPSGRYRGIDWYHLGRARVTSSLPDTPSPFVARSLLRL